MTREAVLRRDTTTQPAHGAGCVKESVQGEWISPA